tara:strand:+ start:2064 stop:3293 length:1230 start_codon:yes stop_codon:yes gene_type:complete
MARSLGLTAYRALARRAEVQQDAPETPRPTGELIWFHAGEPGSLLAVLDLAQRLGATRPGLSLLITHAKDDRPPPLPVQHDVHIFLEPAPTEHPASVAAYLDHWQPDACIWVWGALRPNLILETAARGCPLILIDADTKGFDARKYRWLPDLTRRILARFAQVLTRSEAGRKRLIQLGLGSDVVTVTPPLLAGGQTLPCVDSDLEELSDVIKGRPVWFAAQVLPSEVPTVLSAHEKAMRLSHRLLLILNPASQSHADTCARLATERNMNTLRWDAGEFPDDGTQVLISEDPADRGLFYRIAPVSFLGSTLVSGGGGCDPFDAASLGSAILYGPKVRHYLPSYSRLAAAGAARIVNDTDALGTAVSRLIAPDQAAAMAHAGWDVISQGAENTDKVIDLIQSELDAQVTMA